MRICIVPLLVFLVSSHAQTMYQTDWSGGPGVTGPYYWFGNTFLSSQLIDFTSPGELTLLPDWGTDDFPDSGSLVSSLVEIPMGTDWEIEWGDITWESSEPDSTSIYFLLRTGMTPETMGEWSDPITESGTYLGDMLPDTVLLLQYCTVLMSSDFVVTPELYHVSIYGWYPGGIGDDPNWAGREEPLDILSNPSRVIDVTVRVDEPGLYELQLFDVTGRIREIVMGGYLAEGEYIYTVDDLENGVFILRLRTPAGPVSRKVVVAEHR